MRKSMVVPLLCLLLSGGALRAQGGAWALCIGIDDYEGPNRLRNCVNDARDMASLFSGAGVPSPGLRLLLDGQATKAVILDAIRAMASAAAPGDAVFIYFSGHGYAVKDLDGDEDDGCDEAWVCHGGDFLLDDEINAALAAFVAERVHLISDSCFSGTMSKGAGDDQAPLRDPATGEVIELARDKFFAPEKGGGGDDLLRARGIRPQQRSENARTGRAGRAFGLDVPDQRVVQISSCSDGERSRTTTGRNSAFTMFLLRYLEVCARQGGIARYGPMREFVQQALRNLQVPSPQNPCVSGPVKPDDPMPEPFQKAKPRQESPAGGPGLPPLNAAARRTLRELLLGLVKREIGAPGSMESWVARFDTRGGAREVREAHPFALEIDIAKGAPPALHLLVFDVGPRGDTTLVFPNFWQRSSAVRAGETVVIGDHAKWELAVFGTKGQETLIAYLLEWDPLTGFDWDAVGTSDHMFLSPSEEADAKGIVTDGLWDLIRRTLPTPKDVGPRPRTEEPARPGEGISKAVLQLTSK